MQDILANLSKSESLELLRALKLRKKLAKSLGNRSGRVLAGLSGVHTLRIEYAPGTDIASLESTLKWVFGESYNDGYETSFTEKPGIKWGARVFFDDTMVDLSFLRIERLLST